ITAATFELKRTISASPCASRCRNLSRRRCGTPLIARDAQLLHLRLKRCTLHSKTEGGAVRTCEYSVGLSKRADDVLALRILQFRMGSSGADGASRCDLHSTQRNLHHASAAKDYGPLNQVLELANVSRPMPCLQLSHRGTGNRLNPLLHLP